MKKYCLHPGKLKVKVAGRKENGEPTGKFDWAMKYISATELAFMYGVEMKDCVVWGKGVKASEHIHLRIDPKGSYELPVMEPPKRVSRKGQRSK
jgi:hypothetical protein